MPQVPILDPGIHVQPGYAPYDSGMADAVFIHDISGKPFVGQVRTHPSLLPPVHLALQVFPSWAGRDREAALLLSRRLARRCLHAR
jgi:hypothetical protein